MTKEILCLLLIFLLVPIANSQEVNSSCKILNSPNKLFWCLVKNAPEVQLQKADIKVYDEAIAEALQMPNPELEFESINNNGDTVSELSLLHTFELGGKRGAREAVARAEMGLSESRYLNETENAARNFAVKLYRLRQIDSELNLAKENVETFKNIQKQYKSLGRLNPEQSISVSVFEIADQETQLKIASLVQEKEEILSDFRSLIGDNFKISKKLLPPLKSSWPNISFTNIDGSSKNILDKKVSIANAEYSKAKAEAWPDLSIGPKFEQQTGSTSSSNVGIALSLPLPILNANGGAKAKTKAKLFKAELQRNLYLKKLKKYQEYLLISYKSSSLSVKNALKKANIKTRHQNLHKLLNRGIVNSSLVIEMHREVFEFYERLHEHELKAVDSLWRLYALRGTLIKEKF